MTKDKFKKATDIVRTIDLIKYKILEEKKNFKRPEKNEGEITAALRKIDNEAMQKKVDFYYQYIKQLEHKFSKL